MSITLTSPINITQGAATLESDIAGAAMSIAIAFPLGSPVLVITYQSGNVSGISLIPGAAEGQNSIQLSVNLIDGTWATNDNRSGKLSVAALNNINTTLKGLRNSAESFAVANNIITGIQVPW